MNHAKIVDLLLSTRIALSLSYDARNILEKTLPNIEPRINLDCVIDQLHLIQKALDTARIEAMRQEGEQ